jgi:large subunit ribosomal protein L6
MKKEFFKEIEIPDDVEIEIEKNKITAKGKEGNITRNFNLGILEFKKEGNKIIIGSKKSTKREKKNTNTIESHLKNMIKGVKEKFEYKLKICFSHFPFTVEIKGNEIQVKNFLGEKTPRKMIFPKGVNIDSDKQNITVSSPDIELAGQAAADLEKITKIRGRDRRTFQDGIYITSKAGEEI